ncbi:hypothetical protein [Streptomyces sp. NBC_01373]|uniref:hypothetical protein n=1 Tax=Streptomyces sp. NBC_01373 TaxID=2903843 RepID=UPI0022549996|nr:hypothetical protein [Streptomyces sp. NBC_01373]MCX4703869.1 hypothetical protein [Streptomyces sp. NBC_01373]
MALLVCTGCTTRYSVGAAGCPQCGSSEHVEEGQEPMPKITVHGGVSIAGASVVGGSWSNEGDPDVWPEPPVDEEEGEESSPGSSSSTSGEKPSSEPEPSEKPTPSRARTTGSRSKKAATAKGSSARSTDGGQEDGTSDSDEAAG